MDFKIPDTYEEGLARKKELLEKINQYNEALFNETELPYTEEEIDLFQEEYQLLDDNLSLSEEEKLARLSEDEKVVLEDGTVEAKRTILDKIHWSMWLYLIFCFVLAIVGYFMQNSISDQVVTKSLFGYFEQVFDKSNDQYELFNKASEYYMGAGKFWFIVIGSHLIIPAAVTIISVVAYFLFRLMHDENSKIAFWVMIFNISLAFLFMILILAITHIKGYMTVYDNLGTFYYQYIMSVYGGQ